MFICENDEKSLSIGELTEYDADIPIQLIISYFSSNRGSDACALQKIGIDLTYKDIKNLIEILEMYLDNRPELTVKKQNISSELKLIIHQMRQKEKDDFINDLVKNGAIERTAIERLLWILPIYDKIEQELIKQRLINNE